MIVRIDSDLKNRLAKLASIEGKSTSQLVRELIEEYINERDIGTYIVDLWDRIGKKLRAKGFEQPDIEKAVEESRKRAR